MNKNRKSNINDIKITLLSVLKRLEEIKYDEQDYFDNIPENLQGSMRGSDSEDAIESLENAIDLLSEAIDSLEEI